MCLGVSDQTPPQCPHSPLGEQGQVERPVRIKGGRVGANPVSGDPRLRTATSARSRGTPFLIWHAAKPRPEPKRMDHLVLLLPSFPLAPVSPGPVSPRAEVLQKDRGMFANTPQHPAARG